MPWAAMAGLDVNRGAKRAREARAQLDLDPEAPLGCLLEVVESRAQLPVVVRRLPEDVAGACVPCGDTRLLWVNGAQPVTRQRFTLAHELGHAWCGHDGAVAVDTVETLNGTPTNAYEVQANAFAAELLVPRAAVARVVGRDPSLEELVVLAAHYGVSAWVALFRCQTAALLGADHSRRLRDELEEGLHLELAEKLDVPALDDGLARIDALPYLSPALEGSALAGVLAGAVSVEAAARAAGCASDELQDAVVALEAP